VASNIDFVIELYNELQGFPAHKKFGLTGHLQRAAVSTPSNIAEGAEK
jgi:four helix bundle protein